MADLKESKIIFNTLYPVVEANLRKNSIQLMMEIKRFIDKRSDVLMAAGPSKRFYFNDKEREVFLKYAGLTTERVEEVMNKCPDSIAWFNVHKPFHIACILLMHFYQKNNRPKELSNVSLILSLSFYAGIHYKYFRFVPNENIMNYTINNISNKFKIKQLGTLLNTIIYTSNTCYETYVDRVKVCSDIDIHKYVSDIQTRLNSLVSNIADKFYEYKEAGNYLNTEEDSYDEENFHLTDNDSMAIERITGSIMIKMSSQGVNFKHAEEAARVCQVSVTALRNALIEIDREYDKDIKEFINSILQVYLLEGKNPPRSIKSSHFYSQCILIYSKSNTMDESILKIKELLDKWLTATSETYNKTERLATKNNFRRAVFCYFIRRIMTLYDGK